ncbi:MAG: hypothetical protein P8Y64_12275 [Gammaproteobacteria bacterium]|jgi:nitrate reductase gamma subunit
MSLIQFIEGPLWYFTAFVFVVGIVWRLASLLRFAKRRDFSLAKASSSTGALVANFRHFVPRSIFLGRTSFNFYVGYLFHIGLLVLLLFAAPHMEFLRDHVFGFGWPVLPDWAFIVVAEIAFGSLILLYIRRLMDPVQSRLSDRDDHVVALLTLLVLLTGCMALSREDVFLRGLHMLVVEVWMLYFPFSRLMHTFTFIFSRSYTGQVYGRRGEVL